MHDTADMTVIGIQSGVHRDDGPLGGRQIAL
jgi:hypothetical protein